MSYRLEGKDIVLSGMQDGIADSPYDGIADMRNVNIIGVPGEASVQYKETPATLPPVLNDIPFTTDAAENRLIWAGPNTLYEGCAIRIDFTNEIDYLLVAGGGGGGGGNTNEGSGAGGGAGGVEEDTFTDLEAGTYAITLGTGGAGGGPSALPGVSGTDSTISDLVTAVGGGGGGIANDDDGLPGGSGGGAVNGGTGGAGVAGQGFDGGDGTGQDASGGGGASEAGHVGSSGVAGAGGDGITSSISGSAVAYGGGGGGGGKSGGTPGAGGAGGGGAGGSNSDGADGTANRGGGGGGGYEQNGAEYAGGDGGSGIAIFSYPTGSVTATGGTITTSGGNTIHTFTTNGNFIVSTSGIVGGQVYYVRNIVGNTFQLSLAVMGPILDLVGESVGTFTTYQYGNQRGVGSADLVPPISYVVDRARQNGVCNGVYFTDLSNYVWAIFPIEIDFGGDEPIPANTLIFCGNIGGVAAVGNSFNGLALWKGYLTLFGAGPSSVDIASLNEIFLGDGPFAAWIYTWWNASNAGSVFRHKIPTLVGQDDILYYTSTDGVGAISENAGEIFDPTDSATYTRNDAALAIPQYDRSTCLAELGTNLLVGGTNSYVYPWDRVSTSFTYPLLIPENGIFNIIGTNQNAYIFSGNRGRIFITNGSAVDEYKKFSDYVTGVLNPYYRWHDASFARNQIYFTFEATTNDDVLVETVNGAWAIDLKKDAIYMANKITNPGYEGATSMAVEMPSNGFFDQPTGTSLLLGWRVDDEFGIDVGDDVPYTDGEAFVEFDMIPIGTLFNTFTPSQFEWKVSQPLGGNGTPETVRLLGRTELMDTFVEIGTTTLSGATEATVALSDVYQANFQKAQWLQLRLELSSNETDPTFVRMYEVRIREYTPQ